MTLSAAIDRAEEPGMQAHCTVNLPRGEKGVYGFIIRASNLNESEFLYIDQYTGALLGEADWDNHPATAKVLAMGVRLHQGELFGLPNLLLMLAGSLGTVWMCVTETVMWWKRRPQGRLGVPTLPEDWRVTRGIAVIIVVLGYLLPLAGVLLVLMYAIERKILSRFPRVKVCLGVSC